MKSNAYPTPLVLRAAAHDMRKHGAPVSRVGRLLALADVAERSPSEFGRLAGVVLVAMPGEPESGEPGRVELAAYRAAYGEDVSCA